MVELFEARKIAARIGLGLQYVLKEDRIFDILRRLSPIILSEDLNTEVTVVAKGGTAMNKVYFHGCQRFSEDLDFDATFKKKLTKSEKIAFLDKHVISALRCEYEVDKGRLMRHTIRFTCSFMNEIGIKDCVFVEFNVEAKIFGEVDLREAKSEILSLSPVKVRMYSLPMLVAKKIVAFSDRFSGKDLPLYESVGEILRENGFETQFHAQIDGASGVQHPFDIIAKKEKVLLVIDVSLSGDKNDAVSLLGKKMDVNPTQSLLIDMSNREELASLGKVYDITVFKGANEKELRNELRSFLTSPTSAKNQKGKAKKQRKNRARST